MTDEMVPALHLPTEEQCTLAIENVQAFLHGELDEAKADEIRAHLMVCEACLDDYDVESMITQVIKRCNEVPDECPEGLRERISRLEITFPQ